MKSLLFIVFSFLTSPLFSQSYNGPESVEFDHANNRWLIANKNNGQVLARTPGGTMTVFASGMTSGPYGIEILGNTLYCCYGGGKVRGFDLTTGLQVFDKSLGGTFLNGITSDGVKYLFITDFSAKKIYRLNVQTQVSNMMVTGLLKSPNGIIYEGSNNRLVFVNWGTNAPIMAVNLADSTTSTLANTSFGNMDGISKDGSGNYYVSVWSNNSIQRFTPALTTPTSVASGLSSPADIYYNTVTDTLAVPNSGTANNVVFLGFGNPNSIKRQINKGLSVYPNPAKDKLNVESEDFIFKLTLFDTGGRMISSFSNLSQAQAIDISQLQEGIYFYQIEDSKGISKGKIVKVK